MDEDVSCMRYSWVIINNGFSSHGCYIKHTVACPIAITQRPTEKKDSDTRTDTAQFEIQLQRLLWQNVLAIEIVYDNYYRV